MFPLQELLRGMAGPPTRFDRTYSCFSMAMSGKGHLEDGDKILLPASALHELAQMNVEYPMLFELSNPRMGKRTHCGVLEFSAEEGRCYIPFWMMQNLMVQEGDVLHVVNASLKKATFVKFRAQSVDFLDISNPRAVLEKTLRKFTCVTVGDQICIPYLDKKYFLEIREVTPDGAASIIETDCNVDFEEPVGYKESAYGKSEQEFQRKREAEMSKEIEDNKPARVLQKAKIESDEADAKAFTAFAGTGARIDGKKVSASATKDEPAPVSARAAAAAAAAARASTVDSTAQPRVSMIGNKFSKKKVAVSAFTGQAHTLKK
jgi:ubiquitin fusion degradation protein 1